MADTIKTNLGPVTAYADAKAHGYTGTREEFGVLLANAGLNLKAAETAKADAEAARDGAADSAVAAKESETNAGQSATAAAKSATAAAASEKNAAASAKRSEDVAKVVSAAEISANTAARHSHTNKAVIDGITGQVTADKVDAPDHTTDLVQYGAFQIAAQQIISQIPTVPAALPNPNALTIKIGSTTVTYDGSVAETVEIADGTEASY